MRFPNLVAVEVYKEDPDVVEEFVDPGKVEERLIDSLKRLSVAVQKVWFLAVGIRTTKIRPRSFTLAHRRVYFSLL